MNTEIKVNVNVMCWELSKKRITLKRALDALKKGKGIRESSQYKYIK